MKGDFSRFIFDQHSNYSLVLMQQGRVQLDTDWNEQAVLEWMRLQHLVAELIGEHGGRGDGFRITADVDNFDFRIDKGSYFVQGALCQNHRRRRFSDQEDYPLPDQPGLVAGTYLVYLHAWYRHVTAVQDDTLREVALGGPDTTTRLRNIAQVKATGPLDTPPTAAQIKAEYGDVFEPMIADETRSSSGRIQVRARVSDGDTDPCVIAPENRYRGPENQHYRVEIHREGEAYTEDGSVGLNDCATFKWSRDNGSVVFPLRVTDGTTIGSMVTVEHLGRDARYGLRLGDWVALVDDISELQGKQLDMLQVIEIEPLALRVTLSGTPSFDRDLSERPLQNPLLRRWDHQGDTTGGALPIVEGEWLPLEDNIEIRFIEPPPNAPAPNWYRATDWWWFAARTAIGDVEWPMGGDNEPMAQKPLDHGHRYAPLALLTFDGNGAIVGDIEDLRRQLIRLWS